MPGPIARLYATLGLDAREFNTNIGAAQKSISGFGKGADLAMGVAAGAVAAGLMGTLGAAREWETAFAGVKKTIDTTGLSAEEESAAFGKLEEELRGLAKTIPITSTELAGLAEAGGALGVARDDIAEFTRVTALMGTTTDVTAQDAATSLGKIGTVMRMTVDDYDNFGNTLVDLGNKGASTESEILAVANRLSATASTIGMTNQEMLGWSSAFANVGIEAEAGSSSFQRFALMAQQAALMGTARLDTIAEVTGMTREAFQELWGRDSSSALVAIVQGLSEMAPAARMNAQEMLKITDIRVIDMMAKLTGNVDNLKDSLGTATGAWSDNSAMTIEAEKRFATLDSKLQLFWNRVNDVAITLGETLMPPLTSVVEHVGNLVDIVGNAAKAFPAVTAVVTPLVTALAGLAAIRFGARAMGLGGLEHIIGTGIGKAWTAAGPLSAKAIGLVGAAAGAIYAKAVLVGEKLMSLIGAAWVAIGRPGSSVMMKATLAGSLASGSFLAGLAKGLTVVGIAAIVGEAVNEGLRQAGVQPKTWTEVAKGMDLGLEEAIKKWGLDRSEVAKRADELGRIFGDEVVRAWLKSTEQAYDVLSSAASALPPVELPPPDIAGPIEDEFAAARDAIRAGMGSIKELLKSKPKFISREDRIANMQRRQVRVERRLAGAVAADDPWKIQEYARAAAKNKLQLQAMRNGTSMSLKDVKSKYADAGIKIGGTWEKTQRVISRESGIAADAVITDGQIIIRSMAALDFATVGAGWMIDLTTGIRSNAPAVNAAAAEVAAAARAAASGARTPLPTVPPRGTGGTTVVVSGNVYGGPAGLDQLGREIEQRRRIRGRGTARYNDPG